MKRLSFFRHFEVCRFLQLSMSDSPASGPSLAPTDFASPESLLAAIIGSSDDAIVSKDLNGIVTSWNHGAERIFGYTAEEMVGQPILRVIPPDRQQEEPKILEQLKLGNRIDHFETVRMRKDGSLVDVSLTISPIRRADSTIVGASKIARNITAQKAALRQMTEANERLARADRMKIEFISTLSHELRTPLTAISGWLRILKDSSDPQEIREGIDVMERNVRAQTQLISDLLDMSRIETGKMTVDLQRLDPASVVELALESIQPAADAKGVRISKALGDVTRMVMGDRNRLQQIIWNLLVNAVKFTPKGGLVRVTIENVNSHVEITVSDTGAGIAPEFLPRIFDRFVQADSSTTRTYGGLGLGLAIAKHLTELHGGTISAKSGGVGGGASFTLLLPVVTAHEDSTRTKAEQRSAEVDSTLFEEDLSGTDVLVVEDDIDSAQIIARILRRRGAVVRIASSMDDALASFARNPPHVLLSDIGMPEHDGYELIQRVRALPGGQKVPAVALTALVRSEDRTRALRAGFQLHVGKPVEPDELVAVVRNLAGLR
jgi:PAS domain S-box-containing protein